MSRKPIQFRRGAVLLYSFYLMIVMMAMASLAVDFGRRQMIKTEMQRAADATAHAALEQYIQNGTYPSITYLGSTFAAYEPIDAGSGIAPTIAPVWGWWKTSTKKFFPNFGPPSAGYQQAIQITISRTAANNNAMPLTFPLPSTGNSWVRKSTDIWVSSVAVLNPPVTVTETVSALYNPWLAGMPVGSSLSYGSSTPGNNLTDSVTSNSSTNNGPPLSMNVTAGTTITFTNVTGGTAHDPQMGNTDLPDGESSPWTHMQDSPDGNHNGEENNIQTLTAPLDALVGVFLNSNEPDTQTAPSVSNDYMTQNDNTLQVQEPFYIGDGTPYSNPNITAQFVVPKGATRLFLGTMDGYQWNNNGGNYTVTITQQPTISLVQ